jgi:hypothetical protein
MCNKKNIYYFYMILYVPSTLEKLKILPVYFLIYEKNI